MGRDVAVQVEFCSLERLELQMFQILGFGMAAYTYISCVCVCVFTCLRGCVHICAHVCRSQRLTLCVTLCLKFKDRSFTQSGSHQLS